MVRAHSIKTLARCSFYLSVSFMSSNLPIQVKVAQYWPEVNEEMSYGTVRVQVTSYVERLDYVIRRMLLISAGECREVGVSLFLSFFVCYC